MFEYNDGDCYLKNTATNARINLFLFAYNSCIRGLSLHRKTKLPANLNLTKIGIRFHKPIIRISAIDLKILGDI